MASISDNRCTISVTVEEIYTVCPCTPKYFSIEIRNSSREVVATGQVAGGNSTVFSLPCNGTYSVTVYGNANSSPGAQTRRVKCCCGEANGLTFIFEIYEPICSRIPAPCPPPPCPPPCCPPPCQQPPSYPVPLASQSDCGCGNDCGCSGNSGNCGCDCCDTGDECYEVTISHC